MRFFRANQTPRSEEDEAATARLMAISNRGEVASSPERDQASLEAPDDTQLPESLQ